MSDAELLNRKRAETSEAADQFYLAGFDDDRNLSNWTGEAYAINDDRTIDDATRESKLKELFASVGHEIDFVN